VYPGHYVERNRSADRYAWNRRQAGGCEGVHAASFIPDVITDVESCLLAVANYERFLAMSKYVAQFDDAHLVTVIDDDGFSLNVRDGSGRSLGRYTFDCVFLFKC